MYKVNDSLGESKLNRERSDRNFLLFIAVVLILLTVVFYLNTFVFLSVRVSGSSMSPTLYGVGEDGDVLIVNRKTEAKHGDIVVISGVQSYWLIKRVIAMEGDTVKIQDGKVMLKKSGETEFSELIEPYTSGHPTQALDPKYESGYTLGEDEIFYLGDNRSRGGSSDSREKGECLEKNIVGVVTNWSLNNKQFLRGVYNFFEPVTKLFN